MNSISSSCSYCSLSSLPSCLSIAWITLSSVRWIFRHPVKNQMLAKRWLRKFLSPPSLIPCSCIRLLRIAKVIFNHSLQRLSLKLNKFVIFYHFPLSNKLSAFIHHVWRLIFQFRTSLHRSRDCNSSSSHHIRSLSLTIRYIFFFYKNCTLSDMQISI